MFTEEQQEQAGKIVDASPCADFIQEALDRGGWWLDAMDETKVTFTNENGDRVVFTSEGDCHLVGPHGEEWGSLADWQLAEFVLSVPVLPSSCHPPPPHPSG